MYIYICAHVCTNIHMVYQCTQKRTHTRYKYAGSIRTALERFDVAAAPLGSPGGYRAFTARSTERGAGKKKRCLQSCEHSVR